MELGLSKKLADAQFQNETEKEIFMAINVCRVIPRQFVQICKEVGQSNPIAEKTPFKHSLYQAMSKMKPLPVVSLNQEACKACYENSDSVAAQKNLIEVPIGGNVALFN